MSHQTLPVATRIHGALAPPARGGAPIATFEVHRRSEESHDALSIAKAASVGATGSAD